MSTISRFWTPANIQDFSNNTTQQTAMDAQWNTNLNGFTQQGIAGNPWNATNSPVASNYFNPLTDPSASSSAYVQITWSAFPGRIAAYFPTLSSTQQLELGDTGYLSSSNAAGQTVYTPFGNIPQTPCTPVATEQVPYGPYGPRGWQDEYCEWSVYRDAATNKIIRIDFTCENPEYWNTLWMIDPDQVLALYQQTLGKPQIQLADLQLMGSNGQPVIDPSTGRPVYNPLNKWNSGPVSTDSYGGAMHLTSTPNTLQTEIGLAGAATVQRIQSCEPNVGSPQNDLICCAQYGQLHRNSDPNIGYQTNQTVSGGYSVSLANPPGLYIQTPNFSTFAVPEGQTANPADFWQVVRGSDSLVDEFGNTMPGNFILHATYEVPAELGFTVGDMTIQGQPINWGGQIVQQILMQIVAMGYAAPVAAAVPCVGTPDVSYAQPAQLFHQAVFTGLYATGISGVDFPMSLVSNSTLIAPLVAQGAVNVPMVLVCATVALGASGELPAVSFSDPAISVSVVSAMPVTYAVPGNTYPSEYTALNIVVSVGASASLGLQDVYVTNVGQTQQAPMPSLLNIVSAI
ncbi:hypothetical protein [Methylovulum psychrotolerans]|uniref:Uncharacterized protein n=1 Tax=Methylovulum psychrotolerans TaxID=1704499 RepID=A0A2S5CKL2_9GAMM|nr:hypothetical protein [Methylovulum psychrotolerans]POZ51353.1 hypothetical protein AADEFJLK_02802 [Methylovulum psychrotolerans]